MNLVLAAVAGVVFFFGLSRDDWRIAAPGAVLAALFGLEWIGVPVLGWARRLMRNRAARRE